MVAVPLYVPRVDPTAQTALRNLREPMRPLAVPLGAFVGASLRDDWMRSPLGRRLIAEATRASIGNQ